ncbi:unnamed protein product [Urochloa humidicola]
MVPKHTHQTEEDMISKLSDDVLILILEKVNLTTAMKASVLSKRWRNFPLLLTQLNIDIKDFFHEPDADPTVDDHIHKAMSSLTEAVRNMLARTRRKSVIAKLSISLFLTNIYSHEIGSIVNEAVENGMVKDIELISGVERLPIDVADDEMVKHADGINSLFGTYPKISCYLRNLVLYNATFCESDLHNLLASTCTELQYLYLFQCDTGINTLFKIDAPNSKLNILEFAYCSWRRVEVVCLPKLEYLILGHWSSPYHLPLTLGFVPCLKEVDIYCATVAYQEQPFKLSELLSGTTCVTTLTLDFLGQKIWLQPEKYQLHSAFSNLRELRLHGIFVGFGLMWTAALLEAAPSLKTLDIEVYDHLCGDDDKEKELFGERTNAPWDVSEFTHSSKSLPLKELKLSGFNATEEQIIFIGAVMERASNLWAVVLKEQYCKKCSAISTPITSGKYRFPSNEDEQEMVVNNLRNRFTSGAQIIFSHHKLPK